MTTNQKTLFAIVANVAFKLTPFISGAFNAHHKARLIKADGFGKVTPEGAKFFANRPRLNDAELKAAVETAKYKLVSMPQGFQWAINAQGATWQAGQGAVGQTLFANALSTLTQSAQAALKAAPKVSTKGSAGKAATGAAKAVAKPKAAGKAQVKAQVKA
jgi:hypothetical protein